jgi:biopolymer transport protein ExbB/TolQ
MSASNTSQRPTHEGLLLLLALVLVGTVCTPLYIALHHSDLTVPDGLRRAGQMLIGPEQLICYFCFLWAVFILLSRRLEVRRQRRAFALQLLPTEAGRRILPEDARPLSRTVEQLSARGGPFILSNMIRLALSKYAVSRSSPDVTETLKTQADIDLGRLVSSMATVHWLAWAIPALGFVGTVRGLGMGLASGDLAQAISNLIFAFDTTLVALLLSLPLMYMIHALQRDEEGLVLDCQQYCLEHLVGRLYDVEREHVTADGRA